MIVLNVNSLTKFYRHGFFQKQMCAVNDVSFTVSSGEVFGFLGPNGSGKSTTIKSILNLVKPTSGKIEIFGKLSVQNISRENVGYLPENPYYYESITARELLRFGGKLANMKGPALNARINELLQKVDLEGSADKKLRSYSKGMLQRAGLAYTLVHDPELIILDEPMSGLDPFGRKMVGDLILDLKERGKTVFFSSHILNDIEKFADRVAIVNKGKILLTDSLSDLLVNGVTLEDIFIETVTSGCCDE